VNIYRNPKFVERYEDVVFDLETAMVTNVANNAHQKKQTDTDLLLTTVVTLPHLIGTMLD